MSDPLKTHVERAVRPVRAGTRRKLQMREELYAALLDLFEEEQRRLKSDDAAVAAAIARFGPAVDLTAELQSAVPRHERWESAIDRTLQQQPGESVWRHALRIGAVYFTFMAALLLAIWSIAFPIRGWEAIGDGGAITLMLLPIMTFGAVLFVLMGKVFSYGLSGMRNGSSAWLALLAAPLGVLSYVLAAGYLIMLVTSRDPQAAQSYLWTMSPAAAAALVMHCVVVAWADWERRNARPWEELELST